MSNKLRVNKNRYNTIQVHLGYDISSYDIEDIKSEIRSEPSVESTLIATWDVSFLTDGVDGKLVLVINTEVASQITANSGYMDVLLRTDDNEDIPAFDEPLEVVFQGVVTE